MENSAEEKCCRIITKQTNQYLFVFITRIILFLNKGSPFVNKHEAPLCGVFVARESYPDTILYCECAIMFCNGSFSLNVNISEQSANLFRMTGYAYIAIVTRVALLYFAQEQNTAQRTTWKKTEEKKLTTATNTWTEVIQTHFRLYKDSLSSFFLLFNIPHFIVNNSLQSQNCIPCQHRPQSPTVLQLLQGVVSRPPPSPTPVGWTPVKSCCLFSR